MTEITRKAAKPLTEEQTRPRTQPPALLIGGRRSVEVVWSNVSTNLFGVCERLIVSPCEISSVYLRVLVHRKTHLRLIHHLIPLSQSSAEA